MPFRRREPRDVDSVALEDVLGLDLRIVRGYPGAPALTLGMQSGEIENDARRQHPQHADKTRQQQARLNEADAEIGGNIGQMLGVGMDALIGINPDFAGLGQQRRAFRLQERARMRPSYSIAQRLWQATG